MNHRIPPRLGMAWLPGLLVALLALPAVASAAEPDDATVLLKELKAAQAKKDEAALQAALGRLADVHGAASDGQKGKLLAAAGKIAKDKKAGGARLAAVGALGQVDDAEGAFKLLKGLVPKGKIKDDDPVPQAAVEAAGALRAPSAVPFFAGILAKGTTVRVQRAAVTALAGYADTDQKVAAAQALIDGLLAWKKRADGAPAKGEARVLALLPWEHLGPVAAEALHKVTGSVHDGPDAWLAAYKDAKRKVAGLFPNS